MHNQTLRKAAMALTLWLALYIGNVRAQLLGPYGTSPTQFEVDTHGLLFDTGTFGTGTLSLSGDGTRMFWYPGKAAFRAGRVDDGSGEWDDANIGNYSVAFGGDTVASGSGSTASGYLSTASGDYSMASGFGSTASGYASVAIGAESSAQGYASAAFGQGIAVGDYSIASGYNTYTAYPYSTASGYSAQTYGYSATAIGNDVSANAYDSFVIGTYNVGAGNPTAWVATDPLFEIGNGTFGANADAMIVYKNGDAQVHGKIRCAAGGDISMGSFTAGTPP